MWACPLPGAGVGGGGVADLPRLTSGDPLNLLCTLLNHQGIV